MTEVRSKDLYGGRYRVFSDGRLMNVGSGKEIGREKEDVEVIEVKMVPVQGGSKVYSQLKKVVYEAFVKPLDKRGVLLHRNGDWRDCNADNLYIKGEVDERVLDANKSKYPAPEYAFGPPPFTRYVSKRTGEVWNAMTGEELEGRVSSQGAVVINLLHDHPSEKAKTTAKSRFAYACFHHDFDMSDRKRQVYRKADSDMNDMSISCFAVGGAADMLKSARERDPTIAKRGGATRSTPVEVLEGDSVMAVYPSFRDASDDLNIASPTLLELIRTGLSRDKRVYRRQFTELDVPEVWYQVVESVLPDWATESIKGMPGVYVSDAGRLVSPKGLMLGSEAEKKNGYRSFMYEGDTHDLHTFVCFAFNGPPPTPNHTADHRNRVILDNRAVNLHWATKEEQASNVRHAKKVIRTNVATKEVTIYPTRSAAARAVGVVDATIRHACRKGIESKGSTWSEVEDLPEDVLEGPIPGYPGVTIPVDYDIVRKLVWRAGGVEDV
jgi:hypothetical protein